MGRINVKGGVWRNTEDEILKAAVMKYGKNQWARIASLLHRKTPKQCKARWCEWLDPSVKKTEWSREEDEKLLHLSKLLPTQWRTIAPIVGRTAAQCLERYEVLIDKAQERSVDEEDARKLRAGEIDPNPENKPAKPDAVDMDEDELEMLSEARARLANTQGKKAKRKARERQLEVARRLALMQKRREMVAAGVPCGLGFLNKRKVALDYNEEIPFEKAPRPGFYDVNEEKSSWQKDPFKPVTVAELEFESREQRERRLRVQDKEKAASREGLESKIKDFKEPERKRSKLVLPTPQVSAKDMESMLGMARGAVDASSVGSETPLGDHLTSSRRNFGEESVRSSMTESLASSGIDVKVALESLPKPKETQRVLRQEDIGFVAEGEEEYADEAPFVGPEDQSEIEARTSHEMAKAAALAFRQRSSVIQRGLTRPREVNRTMLKPTGGTTDPSEELIKREMLALLQFDNHLDPIPGATAATQKRREKESLINIDQFDETEMEAARSLIAQESALLRGSTELGVSAFGAVWEECYGQLLFVPGEKRFTRASMSSRREVIESCEHLLETRRSQMASGAKKALKTEKKLKVLHGGYLSRSQTLSKAIQETGDTLESSYIELDTFQRLRLQESAAVSQRLRRLEENVRGQEEREVMLQGEYQRVMDELNELRNHNN